MNTKRAGLWMVALATALMGMASTAEARPRMVVTTPPIFQPRVVVNLPAPRLPVSVVVVRPPLRPYAAVYRAELGNPRRVYVDAYRDVYGRYVPAYWTWTY